MAMVLASPVPSPVLLSDVFISVKTVLDVKLTPIPSFHSHLEPLRSLKSREVANLVTASYSVYEDTGERNSLELGQDPAIDPTAFIKLHKMLHKDAFLQTP